MPGKIGVGGAGAAPPINVAITIEGADKASAEFKRIRRASNAKLRDAMEAVGKREVLPLIVSRLPRKSATDSRGLPVSKMADSMYVKRDRLDVVIASRLTGQKNRALGWIDFGGIRKYTTKTGTEVVQKERTGPRVLVSVLAEKQPAIRNKIEDAIMAEFAKGFEVT